MIVTPQLGSLGCHMIGLAENLPRFIRSEKVSYDWRSSLKLPTVQVRPIAPVIKFSLFGIFILLSYGLSTLNGKTGRSGRTTNETILPT